VPALAVPLDQRAEDLDAPDDGPQVHAQRPVPRGIAPHAVGPAAADAGIVDQDVDLAVARESGLGRRRELALERDVGPHAFDVGVGQPQFLERRRQSCLLDVAKHDLHASLSQGGGNPEPDA
jgi:hypothetical protein